ncbi:hypothetical protein PanWU01x14_212020 [Parasponia andersonii]|uniref:Uncharacterized protein n=1 Tax=Parasponia andersonii TaxID=3476 RepID=A0A2P5BT32_PARAD|nr:hypothetical protein PanWU01x14_212020 [Parasponia andersonii]
MEAKQNPKEAEAEKTKSLSSTETKTQKDPDADSVAQPRFKPKPGSVFPAPRRLVKSLILDIIMECFGYASPTSEADKPKSTSTSHVYPYPSEKSKYVK